VIEEVCVDDCVDVCDVVADVVTVDSSVLVALEVMDVVPVDVAVDVIVVVIDEVAVEVCVATHASHATGHMSAILTPKSTSVHAYEPVSLVQLSLSSLPLHSPWVIGVDVPVVVAVDDAVVVAVVRQLLVASMTFLVRFCFTMVFSAAATVGHASAPVRINVCQLSTASPPLNTDRRRVAMDTLVDVLTRSTLCEEPSPFLNAWQMICPFNDPRHSSLSVAATIADTWSLHSSVASPGIVSNASSKPWPSNSSPVGVHSNVGHVPHVAGQLLVASIVLPNNSNGALPHLSAKSVQPNSSSSNRQRPVVVTVVVTVVVRDEVAVVVSEVVPVLVNVVLSHPLVSTLSGSKRKVSMCFMSLPATDLHLSSVSAYKSPSKSLSHFVVFACPVIAAMCSSAAEQSEGSTFK